MGKIIIASSLKIRDRTNISVLMKFTLYILLCLFLTFLRNVIVRLFRIIPANKWQFSSTKRFFLNPSLSLSSPSRHGPSIIIYAM